MEVIKGCQKKMKYENVIITFITWLNRFRDEKETCDWFPSQSEFCNMDR